VVVENGERTETVAAQSHEGKKQPLLMMEEVQERVVRDSVEDLAGAREWGRRLM
jgi:hypothetical protein